MGVPAQALILRFVVEVNKKLSPLAELHHMKDRNGHFFKVYLINNEYIERSVFNVTREYRKLIIEKAMEYFHTLPSFNNTEIAFWFNEWDED